MNYSLENFNYTLPEKLIATEPMRPRDHSRLLVLDKVSGLLEHCYFYDLPKYLQAGDVLVINNTKVFPARFLGHKTSGGQVEVFLLKPLGNKIWQCLLGGKLKEGQEIIFPSGLKAQVLKKEGGEAQVAFSFLNKTWSEKKFWAWVERYGRVPLPPYIKRQMDKADRKNYQTVYASDKQKASVAAPTAGLHFTPKLLKTLKKQGIEILEITLHVGLGTFLPIKTEDIREHKMHEEFLEIKKAAIQKLLKAKKEKRRIVAVGTTSLRALETWGGRKQKKAEDFRTSTSIFIYPPYDFKVVSALITNFHLPKSSLLLLVSALAGQDKIIKAYQAAIKKKYRFYSYGDAMLIK